MLASLQFFVIEQLIQSKKKNYAIAMCLFAEEVERIQRIPRVVTEKVERRYLRHLDADLRDLFTVKFDFKGDDFPRLLLCLKIPVYFELDNGSVCNCEESLLIFLRLFDFPERHIYH